MQGTDWRCLDLGESPHSHRNYSNEFFTYQVDRSANSAAVVVPLVLSLLPAKSVIDLGCGVGPWAAEFLAHDVPDVSRSGITWGLSSA